MRQMLGSVDRGHVVAIVDADKKLTVLSGSQSLLPQSVPLTLLKSGAKETEPLYQQEVRIRTVPLRDQEFIIIGASVSDVNAFRVRNTQLLVQFSLQFLKMKTRLSSMQRNGFSIPIIILTQKETDEQSIYRR